MTIVDDECVSNFGDTSVPPYTHNPYVIICIRRIGKTSLNAGAGAATISTLNIVA